MNLRELFGKNVRRVREEQNLTQEELAQRAVLHRSYLGAVERGNRNICIDNIAKIARALGVTVAALFEDNSNDSDSGK